MDRKIFILFTFFLLVGCSNQDVLVEKSNHQTYEINDYYDRPQEGYMRVCSINESPHYTYIVYNGKAYQKVDDDKGVISETIVTKTEFCTSLKQNNYKWDCFSLTPGDYISHYNSIADNTKYPSNQALGLECEDLPYEEGIFEI
jgi:hypothetical protein